MVPLRFAVHIQGNDFRAAAFSGVDISELAYLNRWPPKCLTKWLGGL